MSHDLKTPEGRRAYHQQWRDNNRDKVHATQRKHRESGKQTATKYGLTLEEYKALKKEPCAICGGEATHIDHCHETGRVRGHLCSGCNTGLGALGDNVEGLERALAYLNR